MNIVTPLGFVLDDVRHEVSIVTEWMANGTVLEYLADPKNRVHILALVRAHLFWSYKSRLTSQSDRGHCLWGRILTSNGCDPFRPEKREQLPKSATLKDTEFHHLDRQT